MNGRRARTRVADAAHLLVPLDFDAREPLHRQIYEGVRALCAERQQALLEAARAEIGRW